MDSRVERVDRVDEKSLDDRVELLHVSTRLKNTTSPLHPLHVLHGFRKAAIFAMALSCCSAIAGISFEEEIPAFRRGVDSWKIGRGLRSKWTDFCFAVAVPGDSGLTRVCDR